MEKHINLWVFSTRILRRPVMVVFLIAMIGFSTAFASPGNTSASAISDIDYQQLTLTGKVTDATTGEALAGVNILVEGTQKGAISNGDGTYTLTGVESNANISFSFIGYVKQTIPLAGRTVINVVLESETKGLEEIVVVGYGTQKKQTLTGAVSSIKSEQLLSTKSLSVASAVQGKIPGVQVRQQTGEPGTFNANIRIRGFNNAPKLVIDNVLRDDMSDFERLNPEDIESISVLKDASSSIYGIGAADGVFIVTTKRGFSGKTEFSVNSMYSVKSPTNDFSKLNVDAYTLRYMYNEMARNSGQLPAVTEDNLAKWKANDPKLYPGFTDYNWWKNLVRDNVNTSEITFNARGGNDVITFFSSVGINNDGGYFKNNELEQYKRYTFRTNIEAKLAKGLKVNVNFYGRYENTLQPSRGTTWTFKRIITNDRGVGPYTMKSDTIPGAVKHLSKVPSEGTNVFGELSADASGYNRLLAFQYQTTVDLNYDLPFIKGLSVGIVGAYDGGINDRRILYKNFMTYDYYSDAPTLSSLSPTYFENQIDLNTRKVLQARMNYKKSFGAHNISGMLTWEARRLDNSMLGGHRQFDDVYTKDMLDQGSSTAQTTKGNRGEQSYLSLLGRFNYDFKSKYLFEFSFREDGNYGYIPGKKWGFFPIFSAGWRIGQETFFKDALPMVTDLKLRGSWGKGGREAAGAFDWFEGYSFGGVSGGFIFEPGTLTLGMVPPGVVNSNLTWVTTTSTDFGFDLDMWNGKLGVNFDYFYRLEEGIAARRSAALTNISGATWPNENLNSRYQKGYDLGLSHRGSYGKLTYGLSGTVTYSRNYWKYYEQSAPQNTWNRWKNGNDDNGRILGRTFINERVGIYTNITEYETAPLNGGTNGNYYMLPGMDKIKDTDGNGVINGDDAMPISWSSQGTNPPLQFGANLNLSYMGFDLSIGLSASTLYTMTKSRTDQWGYGTQYQMFLTKYLDRWHTENVTDNPFDPATVWIPGRWEALTQNANTTSTGLQTDKWRINASYLRFKTLELSYNIPFKYVNSVRLKSARIFVNCYNLFTFCNKDLKDMDPERDEGSYGAGNTYPIMRSYNFGLNIKF